MLWSRSNLDPAPGPINLHFLQINFVQQVMTFIISLINIAIFTQIQRENRYGTLLKKWNNFTLVFKLHFLLSLVLKFLCYPEPVKIELAPQHWVGTTTKNLLTKIKIDDRPFSWANTNNMKFKEKKWPYKTIIYNKIRARGRGPNLENVPLVY